MSTFILHFLLLNLRRLKKMLFNLIHHSQFSYRLPKHRNISSAFFDQRVKLFNIFITMNYIFLNLNCLKHDLYHSVFQIILYFKTFLKCKELTHIEYLMI